MFGNVCIYSVLFLRLVVGHGGVVTTAVQDLLLLAAARVELEAAGQVVPDQSGPFIQPE